jgi:thiosulfate reductase cytochrome b subunit
MSQSPQGIFPLHVRAWHWLNAALFLVLAVTGFSLHFAGVGISPVPFRAAVFAHNVAGALAITNFAVFVGILLASGSWRQYTPAPSGFFARLFRQALYYGQGVFRGEPHPFHASRENRFNPLQQVTYLAAMFAGFPLLAVTGFMLLFPGAAPERVAGIAGLWPVAILHTLLAYFFLAFLVVHVFLALAMAEPETGLRAMLQGCTASEESNTLEGETDEMELETV